MSWIWWLILGMLIGWIVEWVIDVFYWRRRKINDASAVQASIRTLKTELASAQKENQRLQSASKAQPTPTQIVATAPIVTQERYDALAVELEAARSAAHQQQDALTQLEASLTDCRTSKDALQSQLNNIKPQSTVGPMQTVVLPAIEVERTLAAHAPPQPDRRDPLIDINGIGPVYEQRLFAAGIFTFEQLAALSPERIAAITEAKNWQATNVEGWIAEAKQRAQQRDGGDTP